MTSANEEDLDRFAQWVSDCADRGWAPPQEMVNDPAKYIDEFGGPEYCASCECPVLNEEYWSEGDIPLGHPTWDWLRLCDRCHDGEAGHSDYHTTIDQTERDRHHQYVPKLPRTERRQSHEAFKRIAEHEHLACPWAGRGEECEIVEEIKRHCEESEFDEDDELA